MSRKDLGAWAIFRIPLMVAIRSRIGLVGALLADGVWDAVNAALLGVCVVVTAWALVARRR